MTAIIAVANHKGGSGKTTTTYHLGKSLAAAGLATLLVDLDDQATLTWRLGALDETRRSVASQPTISDVLDGYDLDAAVCVADDDDHLAYIPADHRLSWIAAKLQATSPNHNHLRRAWNNSTADFDVVLLDCAPSAGVLLVNALALATHLIIPSLPTAESYDAAHRMVNMATEVGDALRSPVQVLGNIITMVSPSSATETYFITLLDREGSLGRIPRRVGITGPDLIAEAYAPIAAHLAANVVATTRRINHAA